MAKKKFKVSDRMLFIWLVLVGFIFLLTPQKITGKLQLAFIQIFRHSLAIGRSSLLSASANQSSASDSVSLEKYNKLRNHLFNTKKSLNQERQKLEKISQLKDRFVWKGVNFVLANIVTELVDVSHSELVIDRGESDALAVGQFVLADFSVIGTISEVDSRIAKVRLITDSASKIPVEINELNTGCIMQGNGFYSAKIQMLGVKHNISVGDIVYARKTPGFLDSAVIVGTVKNCKINEENPLFWDITVKPACDVEQLDNVSVIVMNP